MTDWMPFGHDKSITLGDFVPKPPVGDVKSKSKPWGTSSPKPPVGDIKTKTKNENKTLGDFVPQTPCGGCKTKIKVKIKVKTLGAIPQTPFFS